jgi:hypothetical protein
MTLWVWMVDMGRPSSTRCRPNTGAAWGDACDGRASGDSDRCRVPRCVPCGGRRASGLR